MARAFAPKFIGLQTDFHAELTERRLELSGEYVQHVPSDGTAQWVVMNYQYIPVEASINPDYVVGGTNPKAWGLVEHFEELPKLYRDGNSVKTATGSQLEIRGLIYNVKKVDANHRGSLYLELVQDDECATPRADFNDDVALISAC